MKKIFILILLFVGCISQQTIYGQNNVPDGSTLSGNPANTVNYPQDYSQVSPAWPTYQDYNYIRVFTPMIPMTSIPAHYQLGSNKINVSTTYMDGWGRPMQKVTQYNPTRDPVYQPYDNRASKTAAGYLPYTKSGTNGKLRREPYSEQSAYYATKHALEGQTGYTKSVQLNTAGFRKVLTCAPGEEFAGDDRGVVTEVHVGNSANIPTGANTIYNLEYDATNNQVCKGSSYSKNEYVVKWTKGQHNNAVVEFTDKSGKLLCKKTPDGSGGYLSTYYIYNELGRLTHIIPPGKSAHFVSNNCLTNITPSSGAASVFAYDYDDYGQLKKSQTPGKEGLDKVVYDKYQRPFLTQTPAMAADNKAMFIVYDKKGRTLITGIFDETNNMSQAYYDGIINGTTSLPSYSGAADVNKLEYWLTQDMPVNDYPVDQQQEPYLVDCEIHTLNYYDNYNVAPANQASFDNSTYNNHYLTGATAVQPKEYQLVHGLLVASRTRILDNSFTHNWGNRKWVDAVFFYDEKGQVIQTHTMNPWKTEWDKVITQYNFTGQPILNIYDHRGNASGNKLNGTIIIKKYTYDEFSGQLIATDQQIDGGAWYNINSFTYDDLGRTNQKGLGNVEYQHYSYNMRGQLTGINDLYVHTLAPSPNDKRTYASILNYETGFDQKRHDGKLTGYQWRTPGSDVMAYGYNYDDAGRMTHAEYRYLQGNLANPFDWKKLDRDYTVSNLAYDANGNIQAMKQRGDNNQATPSPVDIDNLSYTYDASGTRLTSVADAAQLNISSAKIHDLEDNNTSGADFSYDENGNLVEDKNRGVTAINYNHQNLPIEITKGTAGSVKNIYTANGTLLQKVITDNSQSTTTTYHYWGPFVYKDNDLEMVMHDEGRTRFDGTDYAYDYFVRDHLGNVRTIVKGTMTYISLDYDATFELVAANVETSIFDQIGEVRDLNPAGTPGNLQSGVLNGSISTERIGAALLVHAMAGEEFNVKGYGYYEETDTADYNTYPMSEYMLESLTDALTANVGEGEGGAAATQTINNILTSTNYNLYEGMKQNATNNNYPRTYLNYLVFDESFNLRTEYSHVEQINGGPNSWHLMDVSNGDVLMPISGFLLVYFSNESHMDVAVDDLHIINYESALLEEQHYYPHGMVVEGAQQGGQIPENQYLFQGNKLQKELDLFVNNFNFRQYDAQIGRFMAIDPLAALNRQVSLNPFHFCNNDPANFIDPLGLAFVLTGYSVTSDGSMWMDGYDDATSTATIVSCYLGNVYASKFSSDYSNPPNIVVLPTPTSGASGGSPSGSGSINRQGESEYKRTKADEENEKKNEENRKADEENKAEQKAVDNLMLMLSSFEISVLNSLEKGFKEAAKSANDANFFVRGEKIAESAGRYLGVTGLTLSLAQAEMQGWQPANYYDVTIGALSLIPGGQGFGVLAFGLDIFSYAVDGRSFGDFINEAAFMINFYQMQQRAQKK